MRNEPATPPRCAFCEHKASKHHDLGCEHQFPVLLAYGPDKGAVAGHRGCLCRLTRTELRDGVDLRALRRAETESEEKTP